MKTTATKLLCLILAGLLLISSLVACGDQIETPEGETTSGSIQESETVDENQVALDELKEALGDVGDWGGEDFVVLYNAAFKNEVYGENGTVDQDGGSSQVINDAVYERNSLFEDFGNLK